MIKKHLLHVLALSVAVLSLQSCITDDSTSPSGNASKLSLSQDLQQKYTLDRWDTLKIAPKVVQTNAQKDVIYEWEIKQESGVYRCPTQLCVRRIRGVSLPIEGN